MSAQTEMLLLSRNKIQFMNFRIIEMKFPNLIRLELRSNKISAIRQLSPMPKLEYLDLGMNRLT